MSYQFFESTRAVVGAGCITRLFMDLQRLQLDPLFLVSKSFSESIAGKLLVDKIRIAGYPVLQNITSDPKTDEVDMVALQAENIGASALVAIGGGSVLDAAKAASVVVNNVQTVDEYFLREVPILERQVKLFLVPTTAGTGAEVSRGAILTHSSKKLKKGLRSDELVADYAYIDPELMVSLGKEATMICGFDVFSHALESYISKKSNWISEQKSLEIISIVVGTLPLLLDDLENVVLRERLAYASYEAGKNLLNCSTCLPHRMQYTLGALYGGAHAAGVGAFYPAWLKHCYPYAKEKMNLVAELMFDAMEQPVCTKIDLAVEMFMEKIGFQYTLSSFGVEGVAECEEMAAQLSGGMENDPSWYEDMDVSSLYVESL